MGMDPEGRVWFGFRDPEADEENGGEQFSTLHGLANGETPEGDSLPEDHPWYEYEPRQALEKKYGADFLRCGTWDYGSYALIAKASLIRVEWSEIKQLPADWGSRVEEWETNLRAYARELGHPLPEDLKPGWYVSAFYG